VYPQAKYFKEIIDSISKIVDEVALQITPQEVKIVAMDTAQISLLTITLPNTAFIEYDVEDNVVVGLSTASLSKMLKRIKKGDRFILNTVEDRVEVIIESVGKRIYKFRNLEVPVPEIPEAQLEFNVEAQLIVDTIKQAIKDAETVGDILEIEAPDEETLYLRGRGVTVTETKLKAGSPALSTLIVKQPSKSCYQISYLKPVVGLTKIAELAILRYSSDAPLNLEFRVGDGVIRYLLAPTLM